MALTKATYGMISADTSTIDLNIDANTLYVDSSANRVGIGTNSPSHKLTVSGGDAEFLVSRTGSYADTITMGMPSGVPTIVGGTDLAFGGTGSWTEHMRIKANGNVGIGTSSPVYSLQVTGSGDTIIASTAGASSIAGLNLGNSTNPADGGIRYDNSADTLIFRAANAEKMRIDSSGDVGIGETNPVQKLQVNGNIRADGHYYVGGTIVIDSNRRILAADGAANVPYITFAADTNTGLYRPGTDIIGFSTAGSERMRIDANGKVRIGATLGLNHLLNIQTASSSGLAQIEFRNTQAGSQIGMPANTNALSFFTGDGERIRIDNKGSVGVGVTPNTGWNSNATGGRVPIQVGFGSISGRLNDLHTEFTNNAYASGTGNTPQWAGMTRWSKNQIALGSSGEISFNSTPTATESAHNSNPNFDWVTKMKITVDGYTSFYRAANEYGMELKSAGGRSGLVIKKPATDTIMGSVLVLSDESYRLGTASNYHIQMNQDGKTILNATGHNVGIGTTSPSTPLHVYNGTSGTIATISGPNNYNAESGLEFSVGRAKISGVLNGSSGTPGTSLRFHTMPNGGSVTERMRIDSLGDMLVGSTTNLNVLSGTPKIQVGSGTGHSSMQWYSGTDSVAGLYFGDSATGGDRYLGYIEYRHNNDSMAFQTNGTGRMMIDSTGTMFLGTTSPAIHSSQRGIVFENGALINDVTRASSRAITLAQNASVDTGNTWAYLATDEASYYQQFSGAHYFGTAPTGTAGADVTFDTKMYISNAGKVGIGTNYPSSKLQIMGGTSGVDQISLSSNLSDNTAKDAGIVMTMYTNNTAALIGGLAVNGNTSLIYGSSGTDHRGVTKHIWYTNSNYNSTSGNTERMRIDSSGNVGIGGTAASGRHLHVHGIIRVQNTNTSNYPVIEFFNGNGEVGGIRTSGSVTAYDTSSDYRLKENVAPIQNGLTRLQQLNPVKFDWKVDGTSSEGFIAHEVQEIFPDAVGGEKDGEEMQGMDYGKITPLLVKAIQEQQTIIDDLKSRIETLEK